jgi:hypothetical protein
MASIGTSAATAALVGLLFAGTIGVDGVATVWVALAWFDLPTAVMWGAAGVTALGMAVLTAKLTLATWRVERRGIASLDA